MKKVVERMDELATQGAELLKEVHAVRTGAEDGSLDLEIAKWYRDCESILEYTGLDDHVARIQATLPKSYPRDPDRMAEVAGLIASARDTVAGGFLGSIRQLVHADFVDGVVEQANVLLEAGHLTPAAVLGRVALEGWLRAEAERAGIVDFDTAKASRLNDDLKGMGLVAKPRWRQIQVHLDVGNSAAHGQDGDFTEKDVIELLTFAAAVVR